MTTPTYTPITIQRLAAELRLGDGINVPSEPLAGILREHLAAAIAVLDVHAPTAPESVMQMAEIRLCGYWFDQPLASSNMTFANSPGKQRSGQPVARLAYSLLCQH